MTVKIQKLSDRYFIHHFYSSSKGNSEEETNSNAGDHFVDCALPSSMDEEEHSKTNGIEKVKESEIFCESDE